MKMLFELAALQEAAMAHSQHIKTGALLAMTALTLSACVVEPYPLPPPQPMAVAPYQCCYSYYEYPPAYEYYGPAVGFNLGYGGWHGGDGHWGHHHWR